MVVDTTVLVDFFRDCEKAREYFLGESERLEISRATVLELIAGLESKQKISRLKKQIEELSMGVVEIDEGISRRGGDLFEEHYHSHGLSGFDALVAATALAYGGKLVTHNAKHFKFIKGLDLIVPY